MSLKGKKFLALIVVFSLVIASSPLTAGEKKGANVIVMKKNGQEIIGELILVRKDTLVLMESETTMTIPMNIDEIEEIRILKKSQVFKWAALGSFVLGGSAVAIGYIHGSDALEGPDSYTAGDYAKRGLIIMGLGGLLVGGLIGASKGHDDIIQMAGAPPYKIKIIMSKLNSLARVKEN